MKTTQPSDSSCFVKLFFSLLYHPCQYGIIAFNRGEHIKFVDIHKTFKNYIIRVYYILVWERAYLCLYFCWLNISYWFIELHTYDCIHSFCRTRQLSFASLPYLLLNISFLPLWDIRPLIFYSLYNRFS